MPSTPCTPFRQPGRIAVAGLLGLALLGAGAVPALGPGAAAAATVGAASSAVPAGARYVSPTGDDAGWGTAASPWRTLAHAVKAATDGTTLVIRGGVYRESVSWSDKRLALVPYPGEQVWLDGSDVVTGWVRDGSGWRHDGWTPRFSSTDYTGNRITAAAPMAGHPDMVFRGDVPLRQVGSRAEVGPGTFFLDTSTSALHVGDDPGQALMTASARSVALYVQRGHGSVIRGLGFRRYATEMRDNGAVKAYADDVVVQGNAFVQNAMAGLSVIGARATVVDNVLEDNGALGFHAHHADGLRFAGNLVRANNAEAFADDQAAGGLKITTSRGIQVRGNSVRDNDGVGLWLDESVWDAAVTHNLVADNDRHGVQVELSANTVVADNLVGRNAGEGVRVLDSNDVDVWNNLLVDNVRALAVTDGERIATDTWRRGHDTRRPVPDPLVTWETTDVSVRNNVMSGSTATTSSLVAVDDVRRLHSALERRITSDSNAFWRPSSTSPVIHSVWADYPRGVIAPKTLADVRTRTGQERASVSVDGGADPWVPARTAPFGLPEQTDLPAGAALTARVARAVGLAAGGVAGVGPLSAAPAEPVLTAQPGDVPAAPTGVTDSFSRSGTNGWGLASEGGRYSYPAGTTSSFRVADGRGVVVLGAKQTRAAFLPEVVARDTRLSAEVGFDKIGTGYGAMVSLVSRKRPEGFEYRSRLRVGSDGAVYLAATKTTGGTAETLIGSEKKVPGLVHRADSRLLLSSEVIGAAPARIAITAWAVGTTRPAQPQLVVTSTDARLDRAGVPGVLGMLSSTVTNAPLTLRVDDLHVVGDAPVPAAAPTTSPTTSPAASPTLSPSPVATPTSSPSASATQEPAPTVAPAASTMPASEPTPAQPEPLAADAFARSVTSGWGTADTGGAWTHSSDVPSFSVAAGAGALRLPSAGAGREAWLTGVTALDTDVSATMRADKPATGYGQLLSLVLRRIDHDSAYRVRARVAANGSVSLAAVKLAGSRSDVLIGSEVVVPGLTVTAGTALKVRGQVAGTSPATLRVKAWVGETEPAAWQLVRTDTTAGLQQPGSAGVHQYLSGSTTNAPVRITTDDVLVRAAESSSLS